MSIKLMSQVWEKELSHAEQSILLALADWADDNGERIFPSIARVAWKTGYEERQVQRIIKNLRAQQILVVIKNAAVHYPNEYCINLSKATNKVAFEEWQAERGVISSGRGVIHDTSRGVIAMTPYPSYNPPRDPPLPLSEEDKTSPINDPDEPKRLDPGDEFEDGTGKHILPKTEVEQKLANATGRRYIEGFRQRIWRVEGMLERGEMTRHWFEDRLELAHKYSWSLKVLLSSLLNADKMRDWEARHGQSLAGMWQGAESGETDNDELRKFAGTA